METKKFKDFILESDTNSNPDYLAGVKDNSTVKYTASQAQVLEINISQSSTNDPTVTELENTLSGTPTYNYVGVGQYSIVLAGAFPAANKVSIIPANWGRQFVKCFWSDANTLVIRTSILSGGVFSYSDDVLSNTTILIKVYP